MLAPYPADQLPIGILSRFVSNDNGLRMHVLEAGPNDGRRRSVVLLHGFPELAYCWRKVMVRLAAADYHVIAPDQRGYGRTTGADTEYNCDLAPYHPANLAADVVGLITALGLKDLAVVGHDFGSPIAGYCAALHPDLFTSVVFMSAPFEGIGSVADAAAHRTKLSEELGELSPPRKHYQDYYCSREANPNLWRAPQGLMLFQRAYYHVKSADWSGNTPAPLPSATAQSLATMPEYYIMPKDQGMAEIVAPHTPTTDPSWMSADELAVFTAEFSRTGYQGGLNWYRGIREAAPHSLSAIPHKLSQPALFLSGTQDWGTYQKPGALKHLQSQVCLNYQGTHLIKDAGHWVQQEQPEETTRLLIGFLSSFSFRLRGSEPFGDPNLDQRLSRHAQFR